MDEAEEIARSLYSYDVLIKAHVVKNREFTVYLVNIDKENLPSVKNED